MEINKQHFRSSVAHINSKLKRIAKENPGLEGELRSTFNLLNLCVGKEESAAMAPAARHFELREAQNIINFDSRLSL